MLSIRRAQADDQTAIEVCVQAAYAPWIPVLGMKPGPMLEDYAEVLRSRNVFVGESDKRVIGALVLSMTGEGFLLESVAIHPSETGKGYGHAILQFAEQEALAEGHASIHLYTHEKMERNVQLYQKSGYVIYDRRTEGPYARIFMRKMLSAR